MGIFSGKKTTDDLVVTDYVNSDSSAVLEQTGPTAKFLVLALDKAAGIQSGTIFKYVQWLSKRNPSATPAQMQQLLDKHFLRTVTGSGAAAGVTAALPGGGFRCWCRSRRCGKSGVFRCCGYLRTQQRTFARH